MKEIKAIQAILDFIIATASIVAFGISILAFTLGDHDTTLFAILVAIWLRV